MTTATPAKPELMAFNEATRASEVDLVRHLVELLGARLVAYLAGVTETRAVRQWTEGHRGLSKAKERRLRLAYQAALLISSRESAQTAQAWFQGMNPHLDDRAPARVLREGDVDDTGPVVLGAAKAFVATARPGHL